MLVDKLVRPCFFNGLSQFNHWGKSMQSCELLWINS
jgi:hypothetical protein